MDSQVRATLTRHRKRTQEITKTLAGYGLAQWLPASAPGLPKTTDDGGAVKDQPIEVRMRMAFSDLGPTFVKLGQMLSTRSDLVGPEFAAEMARLRSDVPADDADTVRTAIEAELEMPLDQAFATFDGEALASGSIGQAHLARLHDGTDVIVKVLHEGIEDVIVPDCDIIEALAILAEEHNQEARQYRAAELARSFRSGLLGELDFGRERANMVHFADRYNDTGVAHFPVAYPELSSRRVLTMERLAGPTFDDAQGLEASGADVDALVKAAADTYLQMIFDDGVYHGDPHPGNLVAMPDGKVGFLDSGLVGRLDDHTRDLLIDLVLAAQERNAARTTSLVLRLGKAPANLDRDALEGDVRRWMDDYLSVSLDDLDMGDLIERSMDIVRRYHIVLSSDTTLLAKVLVEMEGTIEQVGSSLDFDELLQQYAPRLIMQQVSPERVGREVRRHAEDWFELIDELPRDTLVLLRQMIGGQFAVEAAITGLDTVTNRIVYGLIIAALFLGGSLLLAFDVPPTVGDASLFGILGWILGLWLLVSLLRAVRRRGGL